MLFMYSYPAGATVDAAAGTGNSSGHYAGGSGGRGSVNTFYKSEPFDVDYLLVAGGGGGGGVVIISYAGAQKASGGTVTTANGRTIHTFTSNGTFSV